MNLKKYNRSDCKFMPSGKPTIRISVKGTFCLNKAAAVALNLKPGDKITFLQDQDTQIDWFIEKTKEQDGLILRNQASGALVLNAQPIAKKFLASIKKDGASTTCIVATNPVDEKYYAIITRSAK